MHHGKPWSDEDFQLGVPSTLIPGTLHVIGGAARVQQLYFNSGQGE